jgi:tryptophan synthase alpha chain
VSRLEKVFANNARKALVVYVTMGYPDVKSTPEIVMALIESGCDIIELGIPFSDPLADGPTIQHSSFAALQGGITPEICLEVAESIRQQTEVPLVFMGYFNPVLHYGLEAFCSQCARIGVDGLIIPDLPPEEGTELEKLTGKHGLDLIYLLAPTSDDERIEMVVEKSRGFVYLVSIIGVTGSRTELPEDLENLVARVRQKTQLPICVGFGISTPEHAQRVAGMADGIIVGSRIIQLIDEDPSLNKLKAYVARMKANL